MSPEKETVIGGVLEKETIFFLEELKNAFQLPDIVKLKSLANSAIQQAALENDKLLAKIAMIAYCLHKLSTKEHIVQNKSWQRIRNGILENIESAVLAEKQKNLLELEKSLDSAINSVNKTDKELGFFLTSLFDKAKIKLASSAYMLGLSLGQAAELTGADKKQLLQYIANTVISEEEIPSIGIAERLEKIKKLLK